MACTTCHAINRVEDGAGSDGGMFCAESADELVGRQRRQMGLWCRCDQGLGERQTAPTRRRLQDDVDILRAAETMRKHDVSWICGKAGHVIPVGAELLRDGRVGHDDAGNRGSEVSPDEHGRRASRASTIVDRDAKKADADWVMRVMSGIKQANIGAMERAIREKEMAIVGRARHGSIVCMREGKMARTVICLSETAEQKGIRDGVEMYGLGCR